MIKRRREGVRPEEEFAEKALDYFKAGYHCSESVLLALAEYLGVESPLIPRIATGFHGGYGLSGLVCGAVSGSTMAISIKFGRDDLQETPWPTTGTISSKINEFVTSFTEEVGTVFCPEIVKCDLRDPTELKRFLATDHIPVCGEKVVRFAVRKSIEILKDRST
jgi:C_GCAxxG_C_C family probable redox protein